tara:strand:+ start:1329 stop:2171 length:843 start_codon:yes stop_codon:yes gene_type:complete
MIDKIYIPTACRVDKQITYNNLPKELQEKVVFVVQDWEKDQYKFDAEYLILPPDITIGSKNALSRTRKIIYQEGSNQRYAMLDDDLHFKRRNTKYWTGVSNMERSSMTCTDDDVLEMFELFNNWLDDGTTFCGCAQQNNPPMTNAYENNRSLSSCYWINGYDWSDCIDELRLDETKVAEDVLLIIGLLSRGYSNKVSNEFIFANQSTSSKKEISVLWDETDAEEVHENHKLVAKMYPKYFKILYDDNGERIKGGFRDYGKTSVKWTQAYKDSQINGLQFE